jgi:hypothetical protein
MIPPNKPAAPRRVFANTASSIFKSSGPLIEAGEELTINHDERSGFDPATESSWTKRNNIDPV